MSDRTPSELRWRRATSWLVIPVVMACWLITEAWHKRSRAARWLGEERFKAGYVIGLAGNLSLLWLVSRDVQRMCMEYWGYSPPVRLMLPAGLLGLWLVGRLVWATGLQKYECEKGWRTMQGKE